MYMPHIYFKFITIIDKYYKNMYSVAGMLVHALNIKFHLLFKTLL